jgi:hypothetical protein
LAILIKTYIVICEGKSENAYLNELNKFFREEDIKISFIPRVVSSGKYKDVITLYKKEFKKNPKSYFLIWVDYDLYKRNDENIMTQYLNKPSSIPDFKFSFHNFEDVLSLHLEDSLSQEWAITCNTRSHFAIPLHSKDYMPLFQNTIEDYKKGKFPFEEFNWDLITKAIENNNNTSNPIQCDFLNFLEELLIPYLPQ